LNRIGAFGAIVMGFGLLAIPVGSMASDLDATLRAALGNSASLAAARQNWIAARETIGTNSVTTDWKATGTITGTQSRTDAATVSGGFKDSQAGSGSITLSKNLYDGGQESEGIKQDRLALAVQSASYAIAEQAVILDAVEAHLALVKAERDVELNRVNVNRLLAHVEAAQLRIDAGADTPTRLAEANARMARAKSSLIAAQTALRNAVDEFHSQTGLEASDLVAPPAPSMLPATVIEAETIARQEHPSVQKALVEEAAAEQGFDTLLASVKPSLSFSLSATDSYAEGRSSDKTVLAAELKFSTPLMVTPATKAKSRNLSAKLAAARHARDDATRKVSLDVRKTFRSLETARAQLDAVNAELDASRLVASGIRNEFQFGQKTSLDVLDAEQDVNDAEIRLVSAQHDLILTAFRLQAALGRLRAESMGLGDVLGPLDAAPEPVPYFKSSLPFFGNE